MTKEELQTVLAQILKDESGNEITPTEGIELLLSGLVDNIGNGGGSVSDDVDGGYPNNGT